MPLLRRATRSEACTTRSTATNLTTSRVCFYQKSDSHLMKRLHCTRKVVLLLQWLRTHLAKLLPAFVPNLSCFAQM
uniref:Uncharacterized protein n=1 Tax=Hyaloperonospora arabidopsidis (strain Emoy2) TaxID=559515 RepID=M4C0N4_HYAAE